MRRPILLLTLTLGCMGALTACGDRTPMPVHVVPAPTDVVPETGFFEFSERTTFVVGDDEQAAVAEAFAALFTVPAGFTPRVTTDPAAAGDIRFETDTTRTAESYALHVTPSGITVRAADRSGFRSGASG